MSSNRPCRLCERVCQRGTTEHHLIPRTCHKNKWFKKRFSRQQMLQTISVCRECHGSLHRMIPSEKELGRHYHTIDALLSHEQFGPYVEWAKTH